MAIASIQQKWCLNDQPIPIVSRTKDVEDPHKLTLEGPQKRQDVSLVDIGPSASTKWFDMLLKVTNKWWRQHCDHLSIIMDIKEAFQEARPENPNSLVAVKVRNHVILVQHLVPDKLYLACKAGDECRALSWFIEHLRSELQNLTMKCKRRHRVISMSQSTSSESLSDASSTSRRDKRQRKCDRHLMKCIQRTLDNSRAHVECKDCYWCPSRKSFMVRRKDGSKLEHRVGESSSLLLQAKSKKDDWSLGKISMCFLEVENSIISSLGAGASAASAPAASAPLPHDGSSFATDAMDESSTRRGPPRRR